MRQHLLVVVAAATVAATTLGHPAPVLLAQSELTAVDNKTAKPKPAPRLGGHPDLSGYWKGTRDTVPGGNIAKDLPGLKLPLTPAGEAALQHNLTATIDPEALSLDRRVSQIGLGRVFRFVGHDQPFAALSPNFGTSILSSNVSAGPTGSTSMLMSRIPWANLSSSMSISMLYL